MTEPAFILDGITQAAQQKASDPRFSAFVLANAGSGKTYVLVKRIKRLLLAGARPHAILGVTFTRAAAAHMANRIFDDLTQWATLSDAALRRELAALEEQPPAAIAAADVARARRLLAQALESPGGLRIQTLHAFCGSLLHSFPFEANLPSAFRVLDEPLHAQLVDAALEDALQDALQNTASIAHQAFVHLFKTYSLSYIREHVHAALSSMQKNRDPGEMRRQTFAHYGLPDDVSVEALDQGLMAHLPLPVEHWAHAIAQLNQGADKDIALARAFDRALHAAPHKRAEAYLNIFLTAKGDLRKFGKTFITKAIKDTAPELYSALEQEMPRVARIHQQRVALQNALNSAALMQLAHHLFRGVEARKRALAYVSFDDLTRGAANLLNAQSAAWVRWKLDHDIDHILVDEAQDLSAAQWDVLNGLSQDFFSGHGARATNRTVFVVGDDKQSIFSFQGAAPALFERQRLHAQTAARGAQKSFETVALNLSFRSSPLLLQTVERVFGEAAARGITNQTDFPPHQAAKTRLPGRVELWPLEERTPHDKASAAEHPFKTSFLQDPHRQAAQRLARYIAASLRDSAVLDETAARALEPRDILILVRQRGPMFDALLRALKHAGVPVAGADRLRLTDHMAVMDLMALGQAVLLPHDDLTLAALLKSPLLDLTEDDLFTLAYQRSSTLYESWVRRAPENTGWQAAFDRFTRWQQDAAQLRPYDFYAHVLGAGGGRAACLGRFGPECADVLDELLNTALKFEEHSIPTLQGFLTWLQATELVIKRDSDASHQAVRVMTVHNAKGLEAKWVVLADSANVASLQKRNPFLVTGDTLIWQPKKTSEAAPPVDDLNDDETYAEHLRLLYVAMTRAEERLVIAGVAPQGALNPKSWYALLASTLQDGASLEPHDPAGAARRVWTYGTAPARPAAAEREPAEHEPLPAWLTTPCAPQLQPPQTLRAATAFDTPSPGAARGEILHRLMQLLPNMPADQREPAARRFLLRHLNSGEDLEALVRVFTRVFSMPIWRDTADAQHIPELPFSANLPQADGTTRRVNGRVDRAMMSATALVLLDYKSGTAPAAANIPQTYVQQMAIYERALRPLAGTRSILCALLWIEEPRLDILAPERLQSAYRRIT